MQGEEDLIQKLFGQNSLVQAVPGVEQHCYRNRPVLGHVDADDIANLEIVRDRTDWPLIRFEYVEAGARAVR